MRYLAADRRTLASVTLPPASSPADLEFQAEAEAAPPRQPWFHTRTVLLVCAEIPLLATLLIRLALYPRSFDLFGDELLYTDMGRSVINGGFPRFGGQLFFLHGPGFFYFEAGWEHLAGSQHSVLGWIYEMRLLNALFAAATAVVLVVLGARAGSPRAGLAAGLLFALEPFCIRQNERVLLETGMMLWVLLGYVMFTSLIGRPPSRGAAARAVGAGLFFAVAVLTKDEAVLITLLPLLVAAALRWGPGLRQTCLTIAVTVLAYAAYLAVVAANGHIRALWVSKTLGLKRMLGLLQVTGFHSRAGGSLTARLIAEGSYFGTTYVTLALAVPAAVLVLRRGGQLPRMIGLVYCSAAAALGYALVGGTLEEHELYLLIVPSVLVIPVAATLARRPGRVRPAARAPAVSLVAALVLVLGINVATFVQWRRQPDDGIPRLLSYMAIHVPPDPAVTTAGDFGGRYMLAVWYHLRPAATTTAELSGENIRYLIVAWGEVDQGYSGLTASQARRLVGHGRPIFSFDGRTYGLLTLYLLPPAR